MDIESFSRTCDSRRGEFLHTGKVGSSSPSRSAPLSSPPSDARSVGVDGGMSCILHTVSKFDTLAGVAIKYGVEVADIKRLNGLVTDLQMFAHKTLQIPQPGRHPPSPGLSNEFDVPSRPSSSQKTLSNRRHSDLFDSFPSLNLKSSSEQKLSSARRSLPGYNGLRPAEQKGGKEGFEMAVYWKEGVHYLEDGPFAKSSPASYPPLSQHKKSKSTADFLVSEGCDMIDLALSQEALSSDSDKLSEKLVRRRQKSLADFTHHTQEKGTPKEENTISSAISAITDKVLALRPKSASWGVDGEPGLNPVPIGLGDSFLTDIVSSVRKSSSTSGLQSSDSGALSSYFQALSAVAIARPIFDGLAKPMRRNKAALD